MELEEKDKLYNKLYDEFLELIKGKLDKVIVSEYELYELSKTHYWTDTDGEIVYGFVRNNTYADSLRELCKNNNIEQTKDIVNNNYIFTKNKFGGVM